MDHDHFDALTRSLGTAASRRSLGRALAGGGLGALLGSAFGALAVDAKQKRHKKKNKKKKPKKPTFNAFGCLNVGQPCRGNSTNCCSGICQGKKPKKGKQDKSTCVAHNVANCARERDICVTGNAATSNCNLANPRAVCLTTTGNAPFCYNGTSTVPPPACQPCRRDPDCLAFGYPAGSACVVQVGAFCPGACPETGGTACVHPGF